MKKTFKIVIQFKKLFQNREIGTKPNVEKNELHLFWTLLYILYKFVVFILIQKMYKTIWNEAFRKFQIYTFIYILKYPNSFMWLCSEIMKGISVTYFRAGQKCILISLNWVEQEIPFTAGNVFELFCVPMYTDYLLVWFLKSFKKHLHMIQM